ncbi:MAG: hydroxyacid dehydrogenase [Anaerolineae bacterium]
MLKAIYLLNPDAYDKIYGEPERADIDALVEIIAPPQTAASVHGDPAVLADIDVIFSGWGMATLDEAFLAAAPSLKVVFYGSGSIKGFVTEATWDRDIVICSAWAANAVPVSEYALAQILFSLKRGWYHALTIKREQAWIDQVPVPGAYQSTVGIVSLGMIGRLVAERLKPFDLRVVAYDPFVTAGDAAVLEVKLVDLHEIFQQADVVSLHTPELPETLGMITGDHLASMKEGATFINTARGGVVREDEMIAVLQQRPDLYAVLDVTEPEPPEEGSPLYTLPNVVLTPHIAGSMHHECRRMGRYMIEECERYLRGEPLKWSISRERAAFLA